MSSRFLGIFYISYHSEVRDQEKTLFLLRRNFYTGARCQEVSPQISSSLLHELKREFKFESVITKFYFAVFNQDFFEPLIYIPRTGSSKITDDSSVQSIKLRCSAGSNPLSNNVPQSKSIYLNVFWFSPNLYLLSQYISLLHRENLDFNLLKPSFSNLSKNIAFISTPHLFSSSAPSR